jgi:hypothetical protein
MFDINLAVYCSLGERVNSANVLDEELRIGGRGLRMSSKIKDQTNKIKLDAC